MDQSSCLVVSSPKTLPGCLDYEAEGSQSHVANVISPRYLTPHLVLPTQTIQRFGSAWPEKEKEEEEVIWMLCMLLQSWLGMAFLWFKNWEIWTRTSKSP